MQLISGNKRKDVFMKKVFKISIKVKDSSQIFIPGEPEGVVAIKEIQYDLKPKDLKSPMFLMELLDQKRSLIDDVFDIKTEEIKRR